jgi:hypothetical protein
MNQTLFTSTMTTRIQDIKYGSIQSRRKKRCVESFYVKASLTNRGGYQPEETKRTEAWIEADRKQELDAAIVRIMKAKRKLTFEQIKTEVIVAVKQRFVPEVKHIKQRVDYLVENEYLKRDEAVKDVFVYLA